MGDKKQSKQGKKKSPTPRLELPNASEPVDISVLKDVQESSTKTASEKKSRRWFRILLINAVSLLVISVGYWAIFLRGGSTEAEQETSISRNALASTPPPFAPSLQDQSSTDTPMPSFDNNSSEKAMSDTEDVETIPLGTPASKSSSQLPGSKKPLVKTTKKQNPLKPTPDPVSTPRQKRMLVSKASKKPAKPLLDDSLFADLEPIEVRSHAQFLVGKKARSFVLSPSGKYLAAQNVDGSIPIWDVKTKSILATVPPLQTEVATEKQTVIPVSSLAFSSDGSQLLIGYENGTIQLASATTGKLANLLKGDQKSAVSLMATSKSQRIATANASGVIRVWNLQDKKAELVIPTNTRLTQLVLTHDGRQLVVGDRNGQISVINLAAQKPKEPATLWATARTWSTSFGAIERLIINEERGEVIAWSSHSRTQKRLSVWDIKTETQKSSWSPALSDHGRTSIAPDGSQLILMTPDSKDAIDVWDTKTELVTHRLLFARTGLTANRVAHLLSSSDGRQILAIDAEGTVLLWSLPPSLVEKK